MSEQESKNPFDDEAWMLYFGILTSVRYCERRAMWYQTIQKMNRFVTALLGSTAFATALANYPKWATVSAFLTAFFSAIDLTLEVTTKVKFFEDQKRRYIDLQCEVEKIGWKELNTAKTRELAVKKLQIESDEPPTLNILNVLCHNEVCRILGFSKSCMYKVPWWQRWLSQVWLFGLPDYPAMQSDSEK